VREEADPGAQPHQGSMDTLGALDGTFLRQERGSNHPTMREEADPGAQPHQGPTDTLGTLDGTFLRQERGSTHPDGLIGNNVENTDPAIGHPVDGTSTRTLPSSAVHPINGHGTLIRGSMAAEDGGRWTPAMPDHPMDRAAPRSPHLLTACSPIFVPASHHLNTAHSPDHTHVVHHHPTPYAAPVKGAEPRVSAGISFDGMDTQGIRASDSTTAFAGDAHGASHRARSTNAEIDRLARPNGGTGGARRTTIPLDGDAKVTFTYDVRAHPGRSSVRAETAATADCRLTAQQACQGYLSTLASDTGARIPPTPVDLPGTQGGMWPLLPGPGSAEPASPFVLNVDKLLTLDGDAIDAGQAIDWTEMQRSRPLSRVLHASSIFGRHWWK
jgi:hypothetical protein